MNFGGYLCGLMEYFHKEKFPPDYPCKSHYHQWSDLLMA